MGALPRGKRPRNSVSCEETLKPKVSKGLVQRSVGVVIAETILKDLLLWSTMACSSYRQLNHVGIGHKGQRIEPPLMLEGSLRQ